MPTSKGYFVIFIYLFSYVFISYTPKVPYFDPEIEMGRYLFFFLPVDFFVCVDNSSVFVTQK